MSDWDLVIPTTRPASVARLLRTLDRRDAPLPGRIVVVDDRRCALPLDDEIPAALRVRTLVRRGGGRGPAAARNVGWRACTAPWIAFLDDDVLTPPGWSEALERDLAALPGDVVASQGRLHVPGPAGRRPTDWERGVAGLADARWATADMAYRRATLERVGGFDEGFPRAYREDSDLALRAIAAGGRITRGDRHVVHPVGSAGRWASVRRQAGNQDDARMRAVHGRDWRARAGAGRGRLPLHAATTAAGLLALAGAAGRRPRLARTAGAAWAALTADFALRRILPGPRDPDEMATMLATSAVLPPVAVLHRARGEVRVRRDRGRPESPPLAVLFDRDGTLVVDVPYNGRPELVEPMPGAREALARLRAAGVATAVISNQSGIGRGLLTPDDVGAVNARIEELLGPLGPWLHCPHLPEDACDCRKPAPGMVLRAAELLGVAPERCVVIGDIGADVDAARAAGARGILVPTPRTLARETEAAPETAADLAAAVGRVLAGAA